MVFAQPGGFGDVAGDTYYSAPVAALDAMEVFAGTECEAGFCPDEAIDRKTMAVWTVRVLDGSDPAPSTGSRFEDLDQLSAFWSPFIERFAQLGVTRGCGDGTNFCPGDFVTRAQMAVFLSRAYNLPDGPDPGFSDVASDEWFAADVARLAASGITKGCSDGTVFCSSHTTTRAQMAAFLHRALVRDSRPESEPVVEQPAPETGLPDLEEASDDIECLRNVDGVIACPQDVPEDYWCESTDDGMVCHPGEPPYPEAHRPADWSQYEPGQVVSANELWPDSEYRDSFVCQFNDEGTITRDDGKANCWHQWPQYEPGQVVSANELWPDGGYSDSFVCQLNDEGTITGDDGKANCWHQWPQYESGQVVSANELWPDGGYSDSFVCQLNDEGTITGDDGKANCWHQWPQYESGHVVSADKLWPDKEYDDNLVCQLNDEGTILDDDGNHNCWLDATVGMVPEVRPGTLTLPWDGDDYDPNLSYLVLPSPTKRVVAWADDECKPRMGIPACQEQLNVMYQPLDYLGAREKCVLDGYTPKVVYLSEVGTSSADLSYAQESFGWHLCATVIDPIVTDRPAGQRDNDVGSRLSDTPGITLAERCRIVLTGPFPDLQLETKRTGITQPTRFGQDCDAWAAYIEDEESNNFRRAPLCHTSSSLAEEWMEHHHGQPEQHITPTC